MSLDAIFWILLIELMGPICILLVQSIEFLASPNLQQTPFALKHAIDLFTIKILRAFQALPVPSVYRSDHVELLAICSLSFMYDMLQNTLSQERVRGQLGLSLSDNSHLL